MAGVNKNIATNPFALKPIKAAKVSEISEATSASLLPAEDKVNFHIGNPVQNEALVNQYFKLALGIPEEISITNFNSIELLNYLSCDSEDEPYINLLYKVIKNASPYMPRGGFTRSNPNVLIKLFHSWLTENHIDPLEYDLGKITGKRECTIAAGGIDEVIRILLMALSNYSVSDNVNILSLGYNIPSFLSQNSPYNFIKLESDEYKIVSEINDFLKAAENSTNYLVINHLLDEKIRRELRKIALLNPLFFIEINNSSNDQSLAREAGLSDKTLRIVTPEIFSENFRNSAVTFLAGPSEFIKIFETVHFQLKGTPGSAEVDLLEFQIENNFSGEPAENNEGKVADTLQIENSENSFENNFYTKTILLNRIEEIVENKTNSIKNISQNFAGKYSTFLSNKVGIYDGFQSRNALTLIKDVCNNISNEYQRKIEKNFLAVFSNTHKMYDPKNLHLISGSSRTALGILGFHCGIENVICCDLSWTYEHCFPNVTALPLNDNYQLDIDSLISAANKQNNLTPGKVAVALNNPHNATGQLFDENSLKKLIEQLIKKDIYVIDDLAYQNVSPSETLNIAKTVKELAIELKDEGKIFSRNLDKVITVHSLSKTDCFAGARIAIAEINDVNLKQHFNNVNRRIKPNLMAIMVAYLFYRNFDSKKKDYWLSRNSIMHQKMQAIIKASEELPVDRNPFEIEIRSPKGSMYPQLIVNKLPSGISLDWLASNLAVQGIGLVPLSTFSRTSQGFKHGRKAFRLTLGGSDTPESSYKKTRRVLIDLNRIISEQKEKYVPIFPSLSKNKFINEADKLRVTSFWSSIEKSIYENYPVLLSKQVKSYLKDEDLNKTREDFENNYLQKRLSELRQIFIDKITVTFQNINKIKDDGFNKLEKQLKYELYRDSIESRQARFRNRTYDRTVHPTQVYSLTVEKNINKTVEKYLTNQNFSTSDTNNLIKALVDEYTGKSVAINSVEEAEELKLDLKSLFLSETYIELNTENKLNTFLSFWGDWDGSSRPSGQGHRLVASALVENVTQLSEILLLLHSLDESADIDTNLIDEIKNLDKVNSSFWNLLNDITSLTNQLEKRYRSVLPFSVTSSGARKIGMKLGIASDPLTKLWQHNDGLEQKMGSLRLKRRNQLEYYFKLNKSLRKTLYSNIPVIIGNLNNDTLLLKVSMYKDILKRFALTPRIHQKLITAKDQFSINTTVNNLTEINELAGKFGNPGMVLGLQISMSTDAESLIKLERKLYAEKQRVSSYNSDVKLPDVWCIPLFEEVNTVNNISNYLEKVWNFAIQTSAVDEDPENRFTKIMCEVFIAGSDLSQQIGQTSSWFEYRKAKHSIIDWLAKKGLSESIRLKLGSGEPMQRQGGYYSRVSGVEAFIQSKSNYERLIKFLKDSTVKSTEFATTPLLGAMGRADLQTFQSNISEKIRNLSVKDRSNFLYHIQQAQLNHREEILAASEPFINTRLNFEKKGEQELKRLSIGHIDDAFNSFVEISRKNFQNILYGVDTDVVGIHLISYFISRTTPTLRDRPTVRPSSNLGSDKGQKILEQIASTIPLSKHGSLLRAIGHNRAQSMILGLNQLTTGMFRSFKEFSQIEFTSGLGIELISDRILPHLPVYEILTSLRNYTDTKLKYVNRLSGSFPPGLISLSLLKEDNRAINEYVPHIQKELLRRHGLNVSEFFYKDKFIINLLPTVRPDIAVLMQHNIFNTNPELVLNSIDGYVSEDWVREFSSLVIIPDTVSKIRDKIWDLLETPVSEQVKSFSELAIALNTLSNEIGNSEFHGSTKKLQNTRFETTLTDLLKGKVDDSMRQFLSAAVQYLTRLPDEIVEVPIDIVRALKEVERILRIEEQALNKQEQQKLNFYILQIARLLEENG
jgi:aspartate/methionine/tyrosine aminotransferase